MSKTHYEVEIQNGDRDGWQPWRDVDERIIEYPDAKTAFSVKDILERAGETAQVVQIFYKRKVIRSLEMVMAI